MKLFFKLAGLTLLLGLLFACSSPPPDGGASSGPIEVAVEPAAAEVVEVEESVVEPEEVATEVEEPTAEMAEEEAEEEMEEVVEEEPAAVTATDGPTHVAAVTVEEALIERDYDQVKGADEPLMTIIEYGDFQ